MVDYVPPPRDLSHLNAVQRYMQKGSLDKQDYIWLVLIVFAYFTARPYIQELFKRFFNHQDIEEGEKTRAEYIQSKAKVGPNSIRGTEAEESTTIVELSGDTKASGRNSEKKGKAVNRKTKEKSEVDKLLDWDDEPERKPVEGDKTDVATWLDKWADE
ncbi:hypothetical protein HRR83_001018 [Exophiala dermatitidis]|uniref:Uncharacterized protein n=2 Tax=Exophiala dermatitidis TaxID=5970 RepID=H6C7R6_EXODN|nr:uncharacterized protein HMPREF1120_07691 [Exophiala dermatitidis NIH/UT8656]KAJ4525829.1 hypothetical protein HRR74_001022 [Exophiala dermatitidis]EHY59708.1 hypothetical protein HMPREF1120_07691 [Exophiala dermatitidis NIH/UT8656]KAJ4527226.1 hypothetical protein HRR73_002023 [Exophiala dermatitidis]KAJ4532951.1 hypothetical protein HRR76_007924 [Exophiala dermatitidis]KAJ4538779.1 hypothetical protein HRR77_006707 [Exophiala dermatitidis]